MYGEKKAEEDIVESTSENVCGVCGDSVEWPFHLESTYCGSMCISCYQDHICECGICR